MMFSLNFASVHNKSCKFGYYTEAAWFNDTLTQTKNPILCSLLCSVSACKYVSVYIWYAINKRSTHRRQAHTKLIISGNVRFQHSPDNNHKAVFLLCTSSELQGEYVQIHKVHTHIQRQH